jgi:hypothetical protein
MQNEVGFMQRRRQVMNPYFTVMGSVFPAWAADNGLVKVPGKYSVPETLDRLESLVKKAVE